MMTASVWLEQDTRNLSGDLRETARFELAHRVTDSTALEDVFAALNQHATEAELVAISDRWYDDGNRSLSVGDVVVLIRDLAPGEPSLRLPYRCENSGWARVPDPAATAATTL